MRTGELIKHLRYPIERLKKRGPSILYYYLTLRCNSRCPYCHIPNVHPPPDADPEVVIKNLQAAKRIGVTHLILTGGEPLLYKALVPVLAEARRQGFHTTLTTNGLNYQDRAKDLKGWIDNLEFSLPAVHEEKYQRERGIDGSRRVIAAIQKAAELGEKPVLTATITDESLQEIPEILSFAKEVGLLLLLKPAFEYFSNRSLSKEGAGEFFQYGRSPHVWYNQAFLNFFTNGGNWAGSPRCRAIDSIIAISPDGGLYLPCFHHSKEILPIGGDLERQISSKTVEGYRKKRGRWSFCEGCKVICYFEDSFLWPLDRFFIKDMISRIRWLMRWRRLYGARLGWEGR
jgi:MoaA/NifB/PqqE/SkfB family radical SAM enzyme